MTRLTRIVFAVSLLTLPLGGCGSIGDALDPTEWMAGDFFNTKKKLPGERKPVFPEGVPGVAQGIPSDLVKGSQPAPDTGYAGEPQGGAAAPATRQAVAAPDEFTPAPREKAKPKPKPKPKQATAERPPTAVTVRRQSDPQQPQQPQQQGGAGQWPDAAPPPQRSSQPGAVQWPDPPSR
jgi:hypothetical protein